MKRLVSLIMFVLTAGFVLAQSAKIEKIWVDHNASENNRSGMRIHVKINVYGLKNQKIEVAAAFYNGDNPIKCYTDGYKTSSNTMESYNYSTPSYENSTYNDYQLFMPYYVFNNSNMKSGTYRFFVAILIVSNWKQIATSDWQSFTYTSSSNNNVVNNNYNSNRFANGRVAGEKWTEYHNGNKVSIEQKSDGSVYAIEYWRLNCTMCNQSGRCSNCNGSGYYFIYNQYVQCICNGGKCNLCGGKGYKEYTTSNILYPKANYPHLANKREWCTMYDNYYWYCEPYLPGNNNTVIYDDYNSNDNHSLSGGNSPSQRACSICGGSGKCEFLSYAYGRYYCRGTGECQHCNGTGIVLNYGERTCTFCKGTGICSLCNGSGKCHNCGGAGKK